MFRQIYNALWYPALPFALLASGGLRAPERYERLGAGDVANAKRGTGLPVWIHAASVGEVEGVRAVVAGLAHETRLSVFVTTMTVAGRDAARRRIPELAAAQLAPLDCAATVRAFLERIRPRLVLVAETELWPNLFVESARAGARVAVINGRISPRSMAAYRFVRPLLSDALAHADLILAQTSDDAGRYLALGVARDRVVVTGNIKFDFNDAPAKVRPALADFAAGKRLLVAGSIARGESRLVINAYRNLAERFQRLALAIAPRHLEDAAAVENELRGAGLSYVKAGSLPSLESDGDAARAANVLLLDTMGELRGLYSLAAIAFVGGSIAVGRGGQNLAEPAIVSVPVLFGPHYENQRMVGDALAEAGGARIIEDAAQMESTCAEWLADDSSRRAAGIRARQVIERLSGGAAVTVQHLKSLIT